MPCFLTTRFGAPLRPASLFRRALARAPCSGLAYGGGFRRRAASQSKGLEAESEIELSGVIVCEIFVRGVEGRLAIPFGGDLARGDLGVTGLPSSNMSFVVLRGELATEFAFACARRRNMSAR